MHIKIVVNGYGPNLGEEELAVYAPESDLARKAMYGYAKIWLDRLGEETPFRDWSANTVSLAAGIYTVSKDTLRGDAKTKRSSLAKDERLVEELSEKLYAILSEEKREIRYSSLPDPDVDAVKSAVRVFLVDLHNKGLVE